MPFNFRVQMLGLCHFIENAASDRRCKLCVLMPVVPADISQTRHEPRLIYSPNDLLAPPAQAARQLTTADLANRRVTFRFKATQGGSLPAGRLLTGGLRETVAIEEILRSGPHTYVNFATDPPDQAVAAEILFHEGTFSEGPLIGSWEIRDASESLIRRGSLPAFSEVVVEGLEEVEVILSPFGGGTSTSVVFGSASESEIFVVLTEDCSLNSDDSTQPTAITQATPDEDFRAHYLLFEELKAVAKDLPVPLQQPAPRSEVALFKEGFEAQLLASPRPRFEFKVELDRGGRLFLDSRARVTFPTPQGKGAVDGDCQNGRKGTPVVFEMDDFLPT